MELLIGAFTTQRNITVKKLQHAGKTECPINKGQIFPMSLLIIITYLEVYWAICDF
jgi:hypothetical protein